MARLGDQYPTAFVTGGSAGLGRAFVEMLAAEGVAVWATARDPARLADLAAAHARVTPVALDLAQPAAAVAAFHRAARESGQGITLLVNNAGYGVFGEFAAGSADLWAGQVDALLGTSLRLAHAAWTAWPADRRSALVNVSSLAAEFPLPFMAGYNVAKAGLSALSESLMAEARGTPRIVIDFRPGDYRTDFNRVTRRTGAAARTAAAWAVLERHLDASPAPARAAHDLRRALVRGRSGPVRSGTFFQARLAPVAARFVPEAWLRGISARYFGLR